MTFTMVQSKQKKSGIKWFRYGNFNENSDMMLRVKKYVVVKL